MKFNQPSKPPALLVYIISTVCNAIKYLYSYHYIYIYVYIMLLYLIEKVLHNKHAHNIYMRSACVVYRISHHISYPDFLAHANKQPYYCRYTIGWRTQCGGSSHCWISFDRVTLLSNANLEPQPPPRTKQRSSTETGHRSELWFYINHKLFIDKLFFSIRR